jgi:small conductance mechanosensitive channel
VASLREQRTALADRLEAVLDALERKTDKGDSDTLAKIQDFRLYSQAVGGLVVDVEDTTSALIAVKGWATSPEGGVRWAFNIAKCLGILFVAWMISRFVSGGIRHALSRVDGTSRLLENFLVNAARWIVMAIGLIMALAALEISIGPMLALLGAAGFVIAFALQDSLSNFASGLMILFFRPFDEGDGIDAGGVAGKVQSMNLVSTTILTFDNKRMIVPNNKIWNDVITNITGVRERRVDMQFSIGYDDDIDAASAILEDIISAHPKVLKDPEPTIRLHALADSSVNFIVRPWALTEDYWDVNWDVTRAVKKRFDAAGIGIPFPQRDVHLYLEGGRQLAEITPAPEKKYSAKTGPSVREDGGLDDAADGSAGEDGET